jgi:Xaa-Pro aminopeptidase
VQGKKIDECDVQAFMKGEMLAHGFMMEGMPICAVNAHSASPHFEPSKAMTAPIQKGDFILIDLWCKKKVPRSVYGDITRVAVAGERGSERQNKIFSTVRLAQQVATDFVAQQYRRGKGMRGCEVDRVCRQVIEEAGYGPYFTHRTGHNIYTEGHGPGAHLDSLETEDTRFLIPGTCFSIEPGIYLPGEFGVRLEYDVYLGKDAEVTGGVEEELLCLL